MTELPSPAAGGPQEPPHRHRPLHIPDAATREESPRVVWTKGAECRTLAEILDHRGPTPVTSDIVATCIAVRATLLVTRHLTSLDICSVAIPQGFRPEATTSIVAAVGGGPHSSLAAALAYLLALRLGVPGRALYGHRGPQELQLAEQVLSAISARVPDLPTATVRAASPAAMVDSLPAGTLLVVGAPGGSWFQRQFFGPGARIRARAPNGVIIVRHSPPRVYQVMKPPTAYGSHMRIEDAGLVSTSTPIFVAEEGRLVGTVSGGALATAHPGQELADIMEEPTFLGAEERVDEADLLLGTPGWSVAPVVDRRGRLVGIVTAEDVKHVTP